MYNKIKKIIPNAINPIFKILETQFKNIVKTVKKTREVEKDGKMVKEDYVEYEFTSIVYNQNIEELNFNDF